MRYACVGVRRNAPSNCRTHARPARRPSQSVISQSDQRIVREDKYQFHNNILYLRNDVTPSEKANALATHFFEISALADRIELILFHKNIDDLYADYSKKELGVYSKQQRLYEIAPRRFNSGWIRQLRIASSVGINCQSAIKFNNIKEKWVKNG